MNIRTIIIEDEPLLQESLKQKLAEGFGNEMEIVALCNTAEDALVEIMHRRPELIFLDIQLPGQDGLWLADQLMQRRDEDFRPPEIIFTTGFTNSDYLLRAFEVAAVSYLVKPINMTALTKAVERFRERKSLSTGTSLQRLQSAIGESHVLSFKSLRGKFYIRPDDIVCIKADNHYAVLLLTDGKTENAFDSLGAIELSLPKSTFLRLGKSNIVNRRYIRELDVRNSVVRLTIPSGGIHHIDISRAVVQQLKAEL